VLDDGEKILEMAEFGVVVHFIPPVWMNSSEASGS
jgi:hypothetical protein